MELNCLDTAGSLSCFFSPFEIAEEMVGSIEEEEKYRVDDSPLGRESFRMKYERKFSACLYTLIGVSECLSLQVGPGNGKELEKTIRNVFNRGLVLKSKLLKVSSQDLKWHMTLFQHPKH